MTRRASGCWTARSTERGGGVGAHTMTDAMTSEQPNIRECGTGSPHPQPLSPQGEGSHGAGPARDAARGEGSGCAGAATGAAKPGGFSPNGPCAGTEVERLPPPSSVVSPTSGSPSPRKERGSGDEDPQRVDQDASGYVELRAASAFSLLRAGSAVEALVARAAALGMPALGLVDYMTLAGAVRFQAACAEHGVRAILGAELAVSDPLFGDDAAPARLVALAENADGYARLCQMLTEANLEDPEMPVIPFATLAADATGLILLTGGPESALTRLLRHGQGYRAAELARRYAAVFGPERCYVTLCHHQLPESVRQVEQLRDIATAAGLRCVASNAPRYAIQDDYPLYDLLTCARLGITVDTPHAERPRNDQAFLKSGAELAALFARWPWGQEVLATSAELAARCQVALLRGHCTAPHVPLPAGETNTSQLIRLCEAGLRTRYAGAEPAALAPESPQRQQLAHELAVIARLELADFFLCVHDIVAAARRLGIRVSGRGSAANSIVAYLLGITGVDPLHHHLLFERFLNPDRAGMPDIDLDVQSDRRDELIRYVERTYTHAHAAMVANVITFRPRLALREATKALGVPLPLVNLLTRVLPHHTPRAALGDHLDELAQVVRAAPLDDVTRARCLARLPLALDLAQRLCGLPRHLSLHNGGLVLTRQPLAQTLVVRVSANGVRALEVDKDDVERLGLIKFDLLGLRTLGAIEEALALIEETTGDRPALDALPTDPPDPRTMRLIRAGQTLAVFQIESPGQWHLLAQTQPETFNDLITQTALFRPGPIQGGFVRPYVEQRQAKQQAKQRAQRQERAMAAPAPTPQRDAVQTPWHGPRDPFWTHHPVLGPILAGSEGILLFQEQILEIAHQFAGLSYAEADGFRRAMSHAREVEEMEAMRARFMNGAAARGERAEDATRVFEAVANFVGYGFCKSHAAEFARVIYQTAWLKAHYPAHYLGAFLSVQPAGFFPPHVVLEEAKRLGVPVLGVDLNRSEARFSVERVGTPGRGRWAIRIGLAQVAGVGEDLARAILWARRGPPLEPQLPSPAAAAGSPTGGEGLGEGVPPDASTLVSAATPVERPFASLADMCARLRPLGLTLPVAEALVLAGACDTLPAPSGARLTRRQRLWRLHALWPLVGAEQAPRRRASMAKGRTRAGIEPEPPRPAQVGLPWEAALEAATEAPPALPAPEAEERLALDFQLLGMTPGHHPMRQVRRGLRRQGIHTIAELARLPAGRTVRVAGWTISAQRPPTAKGMAFLVLEDETGRLPVAIPPPLAGELYRRIRNARVVLITGRVESVRWYRSLLAHDLRAIPDAAAAAAAG
jgi:error-prone DNA polymerase